MKKYQFLEKSPNYINQFSAPINEIANFGAFFMHFLPNFGVKISDNSDTNAKWKLKVT